MHFKILVVFAFTLHIYLHLCKATNLYRLFTIIFYWSKATFTVYLENYIYIYIYIYSKTYFGKKESEKTPSNQIKYVNFYYFILKHYSQSTNSLSQM